MTVKSFLMIPNRKIPAVGNASYGRDFLVFVYDIPHKVLERICNPNLFFPYGKRKVKVAEMFGDLHDFVYFCIVI